MSENKVLDLSAKILVVDDIMTVRKIMTRLLGQIGFKNIVEATNGSEALEQAQKTQFDLIISDWNMPKLCGLELLAKLRENSRYKKIPFIMITANNSRDHVVDAAKKGVSAFIGKPFSVDTLRCRIEQAMSNSEDSSSHS
jgi:two-component system chemotaxis response regulator CheY